MSANSNDCYETDLLLLPAAGYWLTVAERLSLSLSGLWAFNAFGPDGIKGYRNADRWSVIVTRADYDGAEWLHASLANPRKLPDYGWLVNLKRAVWGDSGFAYSVFASAERHVNIHSYCLHLWGRADGRNVLPDFGSHGTI